MSVIVPALIVPTLIVIATAIAMTKTLLDKYPHPTEAQIRKALAANYCRCGTHNRIVRAIQRAAKETA